MLVIANTLFQTQETTLHMMSLDGQHWDQIYYVLCSWRWRSSKQSAKARPGADCGSECELLLAKFRLKLKKVGKTTRPFRCVRACVCVCVCVLVAQSCSTLWDPMNYSLPGPSVHGILQVRMLMGCYFLLQRIFPTRGLNLSLALAARFFTTEPPGKPQTIHTWV